MVRWERETDALEGFLDSTEIASSDMAIAELPRAMRRISTEPGAASLRRLLTEAERVLRRITLVPVDRRLLTIAGRFDDPHMRALDAIHVATALAMADDLGSFVSYDRRQAATARSLGLPLAQPGL